MKTHSFIALLLACACLGLVACSGESPTPDYTDPNAHFDPAAVAEVDERGLTRYFGKFTPSREEGVDPILYSFAPDENGPICMQGAPFKMSVRTGTSDDLLIFLEGGGACWTGNCVAKTNASGWPLSIGWCDPERGPLASFNLVYVSYCDGSVFVGDNEVSDRRNGAPNGIRYHHGLHNLSAALDVAKNRFPNPRRIVLAGSSGGGYGTIAATILVRVQWPNRKLFVIDDAGLGFTNPNTPEMWAAIDRDWNVSARIPRDCKDCSSGQLTPIFGWSLAHDPTLRVATFSYYEDSVISGVFLDMAGPDFKTLMLNETGKVHDAFPSRFERYFMNGIVHSAIVGGYYDLSVNGVLLTDWTQRMIDGRTDWNDLLQ